MDEGRLVVAGENEFAMWGAYGNDEGLAMIEPLLAEMTAIERGRKNGMGKKYGTERPRKGLRRWA